MIQSMTAFSQVHLQTADAELMWEMRSVNHRYLDVTFRLPEPFRYLEPSFRQSLRGKVARGKLDFQLKLTEIGSRPTTVLVQHQLVAGLLEAKQTLVDVYSLPDDMQLSHVMMWPGVISEQQSKQDCLSDTVKSLFEKGLERLIEGKCSEGLVLMQCIEQRLASLHQEMAFVRESMREIMPMAQDKLVKRLDELRVNVDNPRLEQEVAMMLIRLDISEEVERFSAHMDEVARTLSSNEPSGRRLDFLMQELNREVNTISSKSDSMALSKQVVQIKVLIEQMREQVQNIE